MADGPWPAVHGQSVDERVAAAVAGLPRGVGPDANMASAVCCRHAVAQPDAPAVIADDGEGPARVYSFADLDARSDTVAETLQQRGIGRGVPVAVYLPQGIHLLATIIGAFKAAAIAMPVATTYGPDAVATRLRHSEAPLLVTDRAGADRLAGVLGGSGCAAVIAEGTEATPASGFAEVAVRPDEAALLLYSSGTSGSPKGVLLAHRLLPALLPGFRLVFDLAPVSGDVFWTPSEWSWLGGLQVVLGALYHGRPVVAGPAPFSASATYGILSRHRVTGAFLAPAALRRLRADPPRSGDRFFLRAIMTGGEGYSPEVLAWARATFGCSVNDDYGLTEADDLAVSCEALFATPAGSAGRPLPGRRVAVVDGSGRRLAHGEVGEIAVAWDDPVRMLGYWRQAEAPEEAGREWWRTGDLGRFDGDGFLYVLGRSDELILVNGYRVSPEEVERQLLRHDDVIEAGVVGIPRAGQHGHDVGACVVLGATARAHEEIIVELQALVRLGLAAHATPRRIVFVDDLPRSTTSKTRRNELLAILAGAAGSAMMRRD